MNAYAPATGHDVEASVGRTVAPVDIRATTSATEVLHSALEPVFASMLDRFTDSQQRVTAVLPTCRSADRVRLSCSAGGAVRWAGHVLVSPDGVASRSPRWWSAVSGASAWPLSGPAGDGVAATFDDWFVESTGARTWTIVIPVTWGDAVELDHDPGLDLNPGLDLERGLDLDGPAAALHRDRQSVERAAEFSFHTSRSNAPGPSVPVASWQATHDRDGRPVVPAAQAGAAARHADPVQTVSRIAEILGVTHHDVLSGADIAERTFYDWKARQRTPRLSSVGLLWALDQAVADICRLIPDPTAWMRSDPGRREAVRDGDFDGLVEAALRDATARELTSPEGAAQATRRAVEAGGEAYLDIPVSGRRPVRAPVTPRRPRRRPGGQF